MTDRTYPDDYDTATYRGPQEYPVPEDWVLGIVEADGICWERYFDADAADDAAHQYELADDVGMSDPDEAAYLHSEFDPSPHNRLEIAGETIVRLEATDDTAGLYAVVAAALARWAREEDLDGLLEDLGREELRFGSDERRSEPPDEKQTLTDGGTSPEAIRAKIADANVSAARAAHTAADIREYEDGELRLCDVHRGLLTTYSDVVSALDAVENTIRVGDSGRKVPKGIIQEHADRVRDRYENPLRSVALMLLEYNRREWLQHKTDTNGSASVVRHGFTENQRAWLDELQGGLSADQAADTIATLRGEAEELRNRDDVDDHMEDVIDGLEHRADILEAATGREEQ